MMDFEKLKKIRNIGFIHEIGFELTEIREGYAKGELNLTSMHKNPIGSTHGGVIFSIADTVGGAAATSRGRAITTLSANINYLSPAMNCEKLICEAREIKTGKRVCVYEMTVTNEFDKMIAVTTITYFYLDKNVGLPLNEEE